MRSVQLADLYPRRRDVKIGIRRYPVRIVTISYQYRRHAVDMPGKTAGRYSH